MKKIILSLMSLILVFGLASITRADMLGTLSAEDFGVMNASNVKGYTAGFGLTDATFTTAQVVMQLYAGHTLLQTNTLKAGHGLIGTQISSPFDVFGTFNYVTDGYWTNVRGSEYGQNLIPTKVVATVVLANGKTVTAENTTLTGELKTIFPVVTNKKQCKHNGWKIFTNPNFKNQGQCVKYVRTNNKADKEAKALINKDQCKKGEWKTCTNPNFKNQGQCISYAQANEKADKKRI